MSRGIAPGLCTALAGLPAAAQMERFPFQRISPGAEAAWCTGIAACVTDPETLNGPCLLLACRQGRPLEIAMMAYGGDFGADDLLPVLVSADGAPPIRIEMTLRTARMAEIGIHDPSSAMHGTFRFDPGGRPDLVDAAMARCGETPIPNAGPETFAEATPLSAPDRFVTLHSEVADPEAMAIARRLLAPRLAAEPGTAVTASLALLPDGTRLVFAWHGHSIASYGMTGAGTYVFSGGPGPDFQLVYQTTAVAVWIDTHRTSDGLPDLWVLAWRGVDRPFGVWRHHEGAYEHLRNVPSR